MTAVTPMLKDQDSLAPLDSRYVDVAQLPWKPTPCDGIDMRILFQDDDRGLLTALFRWAPGSSLPLHEHVDIEQTYVLEGSIVDDEGEVTAGNFVWRPSGSSHMATAPNGALILATFLKPNIFLDDKLSGQQLK